LSIASAIRAWEDPLYRKSLSDVPDNPVGYIELTEDELTEVMGAAQSGNSFGCNTKTCVVTRGQSDHCCR
jgi:mersacidin/lichenicidin family type 2 lantibiotic